jgi:hypothetical protein
VIRLYGIEQALDLLTGSSITMKSSMFSLSNATGLTLLEKDKLYVWMLILHYLITKALPRSVCSSWMIQLVKNADPVMSTPLFALDWTETFNEETPLDKDTLYAATNLLLSLFSHFGNRMCRDTREKPLFISVIRTMFSFLSCTNNYKIAGALLLMKRMETSRTLQPEIGEMIAELQFKLNNSSNVLLKFLLDANKIATRPQLFPLAHTMAALYNEKNTLDSINCLMLAVMLSLPLVEDKWNRSTAESVLSADFSKYDDEHRGRMIEMIRMKYMDLVNLGSNMQSRSVLETNRRNAFVWINLLLLTKLTITCCPQLAESLEETLGQVFNEGRKYLTSYDGKMIFFKYTKKLMNKK